MLLTDLSNYPEEAYPHLLPDVLSPSEWRSWRRLFLISTIRALDKLYSTNGRAHLCIYQQLFNFLDKPSYAGNKESVFLYIVHVSGEFKWDYLIPIEAINPSKPWIKWVTATKNKNISFYKYGITKYPDIFSRDKINYKSIIDFNEVPLAIASWAESALRSKLSLRYPNSMYPVYFGNKSDGSQEGLNKDFIGYSETFHFRQRSELMRGYCEATIRAVKAVYDVYGDDALTVYSHAASKLEFCLTRLINKKLLRLSLEYSRKVGGLGGDPIPEKIKDELEWALSSCSDNRDVELFLPFIRRKFDQLNLFRIISDDFLLTLDETARRKVLYSSSVRIE